MTSTTRGRSKATDTPMSSESQGEGAAPLQEAAGDIADQATHTADVKASNAMTQVGDALEQVAKAARDAAQSLREQRPEVANVVETAASKAEEAATYLREHNAREVMSTAEQTARKQPGLVIAGGLALGLVAARFLRSASGPSSGPVLVGVRVPGRFPGNGLRLGVRDELRLVRRRSGYRFRWELGWRPRHSPVLHGRDDGRPVGVRPRQRLRGRRTHTV